MSENRFEITRAFSLKKNLGNYENFDCFISLKESFDKRPSGKEIERVSTELYASCVAQVMSDTINTKKLLGKEGEQYEPTPKEKTQSMFAKKLPNERSAEKLEEAELELAASEDPTNEDLAG